MEPQEKFTRQQLAILERQKINFLFIVEAKEDVDFWRKVFEKCEVPFSYKLSSNPPSDRNIGTPGKGNLLKYQALCEKYKSRKEKLKLCLDSDYDFLLDTENFNIQNHILQTYVYSIENYKCFAPSLYNLCKTASLNNTDSIFDFQSFLAEYSKAIFPLLLLQIVSESEYDKFYLMDEEFTLDIRINTRTDDSIDNFMIKFEAFKIKVQAKLDKLYSENNINASDLENLKQKLIELGVTESNCYLFANGHGIEFVVVFLLKCITEKLAEQKRTELSNEEKASYQKEYLKNDLEELLQNNHNFYTCKFFPNIKTDVNYLNTTLA